MAQTLISTATLLGFVPDRSNRAPVLVVRELDEIPLDALVAVFLLLHLKHELIELLL